MVPPINVIACEFMKVFLGNDHRGVDLKMAAKAFLATVHPSSILRAPPPARDEAYAQLVADLKVVKVFCGSKRK